jgi:spermidine/putrescine-binding protein
LTRESKPGFKTFIYSEGAVILNNSPNKEAAKKFLNFMIESENNQEYCARVGQAPVHKMAEPVEAVKAVAYKDDEVAQFSHSPDFLLLNREMNEMQRRYETDIAPFL